MSGSQTPTAPTQLPLSPDGDGIDLEAARKRLDEIERHLKQRPDGDGLFWADHNVSRASVAWLISELRASLLARQRDGERETKIVGYALVSYDGVVERLTIDPLNSLVARCNELNVRGAPYRLEPVVFAPGGSTPGAAPDASTETAT